VTGTGGASSPSIEECLRPRTSPGSWKERGECEKITHASTRQKQKGGRRVKRLFVLLALGSFLLTWAPIPASAEERTISGTIVRLDASGRTFTVQDGKGVMWNYKVDRNADIALEDFREGDRVSVTIGRATPLNMITAADRLRKGDRVTKIPF
jgi:hypothetical protein